MKFIRPDCEQCISYEVCGIKSDVSLFRNDLANMEFCNGKTYMERLSTLVVKVECNHFIPVNNMEHVE